MLVGSYNHKIDSKGRTVLPAKFRGELGSSVVATIGIDRCIALYPVPRWEELLEKLKDLSSFKKKGWLQSRRSTEPGASSCRRYCATTRAPGLRSL